jgi:hypothetical protein
MLTYACDAGAYFQELQHLLRLCHYATCGALASFTDDAQVLLVLLLYCCFTAALLLLYCCFTAALLLLYCCFTAALLLLYCCFTALASFTDDAHTAMRP